MTEETTIADPRSPERIAAAQTYARARELRLQADTAILQGQRDPVRPQRQDVQRPFAPPVCKLLGPTQNVLSYQIVRKLLIGIAGHAGLHDGGSPVTFTPHNFRRLFATELVGSGLPLHIVSTLLGHLNLESSRGYSAVFPEQVIQAHHTFIERRRQTRPDHELRSATEAEWAEFEQHFLLRRVALGTCHRPYATPCVHEHACIKCRFLQVDPAQTGRIETWPPTLKNGSMKHETTNGLAKSGPWKKASFTFGAAGTKRTGSGIRQ